MAGDDQMPYAQLKSKLLFNLSLSSNELFHSKLIAYIAEYFSFDYKGHACGDDHGEDSNDEGVDDLQSDLHRCVFKKVMEALGLKPPNGFPRDNSGEPGRPCRYVYVVKREYRNF